MSLPCALRSTLHPLTPHAPPLLSRIASAPPFSPTQVLQLGHVHRGRRPLRRVGGDAGRNTHAQQAPIHVGLAARAIPQDDMYGNTLHIGHTLRHILYRASHPAFFSPNLPILHATYYAALRTTARCILHAAYYCMLPPRVTITRNAIDSFFDSFFPPCD